MAKLDKYVKNEIPYCDKADFYINAFNTELKLRKENKHVDLTWFDNEGNGHLLANMSDSYIKNCISMLKRVNRRNKNIDELNSAYFELY